MTSAETFNYESNKELHSLFLKHSLRLCYEKRWVTEWLFNDLTSSVIRTDFVIPPNLFNRGKLWSVQAWKSIPNTTQISTTMIGNIAYIPVSHSDDITIGYAFTFAFPAESQKQGIVLSRNLPFDIPCITRFAYDHRQDGNLMFTTTGGNPKQIGISSDFYSAGNRSEGTFVVPAKEYTWDDLPQYPSAVFLGTQHLFKSLRINTMRKEMFSQDQFHFLNTVSPVPSLHDIDQHLDVLNSIDSNRDQTPAFNSTMDAEFTGCREEPHQTCKAAHDNISNFTNTFNKINHTPLVVSHDGHVSDRATFSEGSDTADICSGVLNMHLMDECLREMEEVIANRSFPYPKRLDCKPDPAYESGVHITFGSANEFIRNALRENCMRVYYDVVLTVDVDYQLLMHPAKEFKKIAPKPQDAIPDASNQLGNCHFIRKETDDCICGSAECPFLAAHRAEKARVLEERKRRNRLSAARSNEQRRVKLLAARKAAKEMRELNKHIENLREREKQLMSENEILRKRLEGNAERDPE